MWKYIRVLIIRTCGTLIKYYVLKERSQKKTNSPELFAYGFRKKIELTDELVKVFQLETSVILKVLSSLKTSNNKIVSGSRFYYIVIKKQCVYKFVLKFRKRLEFYRRLKAFLKIQYSILRVYGKVKIGINDCLENQKLHLLANNYSLIDILLNNITNPYTLLKNIFINSLMNVLTLNANVILFELIIALERHREPFNWVINYRNFADQFTYWINYVVLALIALVYAIKEIVNCFFFDNYQAGLKKLRDNCRYFNQKEIISIINKYGKSIEEEGKKFINKIRLGEKIDVELKKKTTKEVLGKLNGIKDSIKESPENPSTVTILKTECYGGLEKIKKPVGIFDEPLKIPKTSDTYFPIYEEIRKTIGCGSILIQVVIILSTPIIPLPGLGWDILKVLSLICF